jgi:pimeloyl-ACP methyl ester carboxylesterase
MLRRKSINYIIPIKNSFSTQTHARLNYVLTKSTTNSVKNLILLPGLLGSVKNFSNLSSNHDILSRVNCYALDLRNQGDSEHLPTMTYNEVADDVVHFIKQHDLKNVILLGHCYGGRIVMRLITKTTTDIAGVIISDISPYNYWNDKNYGFVRSLKIMIERFMAVDLNQTQTGILNSFVKISGSQIIALSMLGALEKTGPKSYRWKPNMSVIQQNFAKDVVGNIFDEGETVQKYRGSYLIIRCDKSEYVLPNVISSFEEVFEGFRPEEHIILMENCGHFPYFEKPDQYFGHLVKYIDSI